MATYVNDLRLKEIATGDEAGTWGTSTNTNLELIGEALGYGTQDCFSSDADATTTVADGATDPARAMYFKVTSSATLSATRTLTIAPNTISRVMFIENATTGSQSINISQGSGANVTIATGKTAVVYLDGAGSGAAVVDAMALVDPGVTDTLAEVLTAGNTTGGTDITFSAGDKITNASGDFTIDIAGDLILDADGGDFVFQDGATNRARVKVNDGSNIDFESLTADNDIRFRGIDSSSTITALTLDMSEAGAATFNSTVTANAGFVVDNITIDGNEIDVSSGDLTLDIAADFIVDAESDIFFDAASGIYSFNQAGSTGFTFTNSSGDITLKTFTSDKDFIIQGVDGGSTITALTLDMSASGAATFNGNLTVNGADVTITSNIIHSGDTNTFFGFPSDDTFRIVTSGSEAMRIDSSGRVGIGTSTPEHLLHIEGTSDSLFRLTRTGVRSYRQYINSSGNFVIRDLSGTPADRVIIDTSGNLLVSTTSIAVAQGTGTGVSIRDMGRVESSADGNTSAIFNRVTSDGGIVNFAKDGTTVGSVGTVAGDIIIGTGACGIRFHDGTPALQPRNTDGNANNDAIDIGLSGNRFKDLHLSGTAYAGTAVGIGTSSPQNLLHVNKSDSLASAAQFTNSTTGATSTDGIFLGLGSGEQGYFWNYEANDLVFGTSNTERMRINSSGSVGIGTTSPGRLLEVNTDGEAFIRIRSSDSGNAGLEFGDQSDSVQGAIFMNASDNSLRFNGFDNSEAMRIASSGEITFKANAGSVSHVFAYNEDGGEIKLADNTGSTGTLIDQSLNSTRVLELINGSNLALGLGSSNTTGNILFYKAGFAEAARIDSNGRLLVGTTDTNVADNNAESSADNGLVFNTGALSVSKHADRALYLNRTQSDGAIAEFRINGTSIGSIGSISSDLYIAESNSGLRFDGENNQILPASTTASTDGTCNLGAGSARFKNLYLSQGIFLDGDGSSRTEISSSTVSSVVYQDLGGFTGTPSVARGIRFFCNDASNAKTERMRLDKDGGLLVGTTSTATASTNQGTYINGSGLLYSGRSGDAPIVANRITSDGDIAIFRKDGSTVGSIGTTGGDLYIGTGSNASVRFNDGVSALTPASGTSNADNAVDLGYSTLRWKDLYLSGDTFVGEPSTIGAGETGVTVRGLGQIRVGRSGTSSATLISFNNGNGEVGTITTSGSATAYNTSSDYRLKENVVAMSGATERLKQLKPSRFNFIADPDTTVDGFLAHEVQDIVPESITGTKDAVDAEGNPEYQGIDQSKLIPLLVATIQELEARIAQLEGAN